MLCGVWGVEFKGAQKKTSPQNGSLEWDLDGTGFPKPTR